MGGSVSKRPQYTVPISDEVPTGETQIRRCPLAKDGLISTLEGDIPTLKDVWENSVKQFGNKQCMAQRDSDGVYQLKTYSEIDVVVREVGSGVVNLNLAPVTNEYKDFNLQFVGIFSKNRQEWSQIDIGCSWLYGMTIVPLYETLGPENISYSLGQTNLEVIFVDSKGLQTIINTENTHKLRYVVCLDEVSQEVQQQLKEKGLEYLTFDQVREEGRKNIQQSKTVQREQVSTFLYTSGTTGNPKAAMLTHKSIIAVMSMFETNKDLKIIENDVYLSYLPLPHILERGASSCMFAKGACVYYYGGDMTKLKNDLGDVKPTIFVSVPRLYNKFYDIIQAQFGSLTGIKKCLVNSGISTKLDNLRSSSGITHSVYDKIVFKKIREDVFGGRIRYCMTGSAPIDTDVLEFFKIALSCPVYEAWGQTESNTLVSAFDDPVVGHCGGIQAYSEIKLVDVPEMNYLSTDKDQDGKLQPRGELCVRGDGNFIGYYKDEERTKEAIDQDGWVHTGDIATLVLPTGEIKIIDRKKNLFKLSQGEYVAPEKLESMFKAVDGINEIFVYGDSLKSHCIAIVVPDQQVVEATGQKLGLSGNFENICLDIQIRTYFVEIMKKYGKKNKLNGFEIPKNVYLEYQPFSEHNCLTDTNKLQRFKAREVFKERLDRLYKEQPLDQ